MSYFSSQSYSALLRIILVAIATLTTSCSPSQFQEISSLNLVSPTPSLNRPHLAKGSDTKGKTQEKIDQFIHQLTDQGYNPKTQGIWIQSSDTLLGNYQGTVPLPCASIAKVATTLVALETWGTDHQFITDFSMRGTVKDGVLWGDLIVQGGDDPFFVWEEAIKIGNLLEQLGIKKIKGNLIIVGRFYMNFKMSPQESGELLKIGLNSQLWTPEAETQYQTLPPNTPRPQVVIEGSVKVISVAPSSIKLLVSHSSLPLTQLLKKMNLYSNTWMTKIFNEALGGESKIAEKAAQLAEVPQEEIDITGNDRISPRASVALFIAIENYLQTQQQNLGDVFAIMGEDQEGILTKRNLPKSAILKSGIWEDISALVGTLPAGENQVIWFSIFNYGQPWQQSEKEQERFIDQFLLVN